MNCHNIEESPSGRFNCKQGINSGQNRIDVSSWDSWNIKLPITDRSTTPAFARQAITKPLYVDFPIKAHSGDQIAIRLLDNQGHPGLSLMTNGLAEIDNTNLTLAANETIIWTYCDNIKPHWRILTRNYNFLARGGGSPIPA